MGQESSNKWRLLSQFSVKVLIYTVEKSYHGVLQLWVRVREMAPKRWNIRRTAKLVPIEWPDSTLIMLAIRPSLWASKTAENKKKCVKWLNILYVMSIAIWRENWARPEMLVLKSFKKWVTRFDPNHASDPAFVMSLYNSWKLEKLVKSLVSR